MFGSDILQYSYTSKPHTLFYTQIELLVIGKYHMVCMVITVNWYSIEPLSHLYCNTLHIIAYMFDILLLSEFISSSSMYYSLIYTTVSSRATFTHKNYEKVTVFYLSNYQVTGELYSYREYANFPG